MPARCVPWPKASRLRSSSTRASSEKSGPLTTRPASEPTGETPESTSATSMPLAAGAGRRRPCRCRMSSVVLATAGTTSVVCAACSGGRRWTERIPRSAAQRAHRAARNPGGEPVDQRDLTFDTPPRSSTARSGPLPAPASSRTTTCELRSCAEACGGVKEDRASDGPEGGEGDPPANCVCRTSVVTGVVSARDRRPREQLGSFARTPRQLVEAFGPERGSFGQKLRRTSGSGQGVRKPRRRCR